ncbi:MAG: hypothetical protein O3B65_07005 [Chloroflexi bacterium]|nr:hypothetical protein [Chloroflexota bacterium]
MKRFFSMTALAIAGLVLLAACGGGGDGGDEKGILTGKITIGPECPVEPCDMSVGAIYTGRDFVLLRSGATSFKMPLGIDGSFSVELVPADYVIRMDNCNFFGCDVFPMEKTIAAGETVTLNLDLDTGIRTAERDAMGTLISDLIGLGVPVAQGGTVDQPFFAVQGQEVIFDGQTVQVFSYDSSESAAADAALVSPTGSSVGTAMVSWIEPPHFYQHGSLLVLYVGNNGTVMSLLETVLGPQFAGADNPVTLVPPNDPTDNPDAKVQAYLSLMDEMTDALGQLTRGPQGGSLTRVQEIGARFDEFVIFFVALNGERLDYVVNTYGAQMQASAERVVGLAQLAIDFTGDESIAQIIQRLPAFMIAGTTTSTSGPGVTGEPSIVEGK